ncbi:hypothetical protein BDQ17DRAFT_1304953 [Cyathus striatus]|nr:hypothetical protein BDQ17DRAFT_1304953 [Cyathus striatus]
MSSEKKGTKDVTQAEEPFNDIDSSDTVFRTSDGIDFYVHRVVLFLASPFFRDMFSLPQPSSCDSKKPIIDVTESIKVLNPLLRLCYPVDDPEFPDNNSVTLALIGNTLEAALKYQLTEAIKILKGHLRALSKDHPLHAFAIACRLQLEEEAPLAARRWRESHPDYIHEMSNISAGVYYRFIQFVRTGVKTSFCGPPKTGFRFTRSSFIQ